MKGNNLLRGLVGGWVGGFAGNALLGALFLSPWIRTILYDPSKQSDIFLTLTPQRNMAISVVGLVILSGIHGLLFSVLQQSIPGANWIRKGLWWGVAIWAMYWLFQEWFIYVTLLGEPISLAMVELVILLLGSLVEGVVVARVVTRKDS